MLPEQPKRKWHLGLTLLFSLLVHALLLVFIYTSPVLSAALGLRGLEFVEEDYNRAILLDLSRPLKYPGGYSGFQAPAKTMTLEEMQREQERRARAEARRREREKVREREEEARREDEDRARAAEQAKAEAKPTPTPAPAAYAGGFGKINTAPIKDQIQRLYDANKEGKLIFDEGRLRVGVSGKINPDGSLSDYRVHPSSGKPEIDRAALAILVAVSESRALGPLHQLTSISLILDIGQQAQLTAVGFAATEQAAAAVEFLANFALMDARRKKAADPAAMVILNNVKVSHTGQRVQAIVSMPRQTATESLAQTMEKPKG